MNLKILHYSASKRHGDHLWLINIDVDNLAFIKFTSFHGIHISLQISAIYFRHE